MTRLAALFALALALLAPATARAHASRTAYLEVIETASGEAVASLRTDGGGGLTLTSPDCTLEPGAGAPTAALALVRVRCARGLSGATLRVGGELREGDAVIARVVPLHAAAYGAVLTARSRDLVLPVGDGSVEVLSRYVRLGVEHVLSGLDHVLFLLALVWQSHGASRGAVGPWLRSLARAATAFTLAHTVTLTATALGWLSVPSAFAEAMIAVSLVLVALDVGRRAESRVGVVAAFGLFHGLGFAGALTAGGLPRQAVLLGLVSFNVGVELGQLLLLAAAALVIGLAPRLASRDAAGRASLRGHAATVSAYAVGVVGAYLFFDRSVAIFR